MYPRHKLFMEVVEFYRRTGKTAPIFVDKHLSYDYELAAEMVKASRELNFGLMAGSSLPVTWRRPEIEPEPGTPFTEAVVVHPGEIERYGFHGLETLQVMLERRRGGETGIRSVTTLRGPAVWAAADAGRFSLKLMDAALARCPSRNIGDVRFNVREPVCILVDYLDGTKAAALNLKEQVSEFGFAATVAGRSEVVSTLFLLPAPPGARFFDPLVYNIEKLFATGVSPYPVERTLLTSTALDFAMRSLAEGGKPMESPALHIKYAGPKDSGFFRGRASDS
ncbi:MAG: hypothetical protein ACRDD1_09205 [Planctomycetia bacterium]